MNSKSEVLAVLSKYGMDLKYNDPFLYEHDGKIGLVYSFSHAFYGFLTRAFFPDNLDELEIFAYQYWWYKKYGEKYYVSIELSNYEDFSCKPIFIYQNKSLNVEDMKNLLVNPEVVSTEKKETKIYSKYLRTAKMLIRIMELKMKSQNDTYQNVMELDLECKRQENEFLQLYNRYEKENQPLHEIHEMREDLSLPEEFLELENKLNDFANQDDLEALKQFIDFLWESLHHLESMQGHLQNKYLLIKLPLDMDDMRKKKAYMETVLNKKKGLFSKKEQVKVELMKIDEMSETNKIVKMDTYIQNELSRLKDKYSIISEMDYATLGDYLNEFDNMGVVCPFEIQEEPLVTLTHDELIASLSKIYENLSVEERQRLSIYHSFLESICDEIMQKFLNHESEEEIHSYLLNRYQKELMHAIQVLSDPENVFVRMKQMKLLSLTNITTFATSLIHVCEELLHMDQFKISGKFYAFGKSLEKDTDFMLYHASCKSIGSPSQMKGRYEVHDVLELTDVVLYYFPSYYALRDPYFHDDTLVLENNREDILIILKNYQVKFRESGIIRVLKYHVEQKDKIVSHVQKIKEEKYRHILVSR